MKAEPACPAKTSKAVCKFGAVPGLIRSGEIMTLTFKIAGAGPVPASWHLFGNSRYLCLSSSGTMATYYGQILAGIACHVDGVVRNMFIQQACEIVVLYYR